MARRRSEGSFLPFFLFLLLLGVGGGYLFFFTNFFTTTEPEETTEEKLKEEKLLTDVDEWHDEVVWDDQESATQIMYYGVAPGVKRSGQFVSREGAVERFEDAAKITASGFTEDPNLTETRGNTELWGYRKTVGDKEQVVVISSVNEDMHESEAGEFIKNCPCTLTLSVFVSEPFKPNWKESVDITSTPQ